MNPGISIIIPLYNRKELFLETIRSILAQAYKSFEVIVIDDGSDFGIINSLKDIIKDERIKLYPRESKRSGAPVCRNEGIKRARGNYIIFLDSDDILAPFALEKRIEAMTLAEDTLDCVFSPTLVFDKLPGDRQQLMWNSLDHQGDVLDRFLRLDGPWHTMSGTWRKEFLTRMGGWDESLPCYQDWEFHIRSLLSGLRYSQLSQPDNFYRISSDASSIASNFFNEKYVRGRFMAFDKVFNLLREGKVKKKQLFIRGLMVRNLIQLCENGKSEIAVDLLKQNSGRILTCMDDLFLTLIRRDINRWRYRRPTQKLISLFWKGKFDFDPWSGSNHCRIPFQGDPAALNYNYQAILRGES